MNPIQQYLKDENRTQTWLAARLGYDLSYINLLVNDKAQISDSFRYRWLTTFGFNLDTLERAPRIKANNGD